MNRILFVCFSCAAISIIIATSINGYLEFYRLDEKYTAIGVHFVLFLVGAITASFILIPNEYDED